MNSNALVMNVSISKAGKSPHGEFNHMAYPIPRDIAAALS